MRLERNRSGCKVELVRPSSSVQARTLALQPERTLALQFVSKVEE